MREPQSFQQDCIELARERLERGEIDRRSFLKGLAALGVLPALAAGDAARAADAKEIVIANWGGLANEGFSRFYGQPFEKDHAGAKVTTDSGGPAGGKIRAMVESGHVTWDLCDSSASSAYWLGGLGLLEPIDYKVVNKANVPPVGFALPHGVAPYSFSTVLAYDKAKVGDVPPKTWADFWDLKKYPGRRLLRHDALSTLELAVMAAGVPLEKVYPIDIKLALDKIKEIKEHCLYWSSGAESEQIIRTGEAVMGGIWHTRASVLSRELNDRMSWTWNQGVLQAGIFVSSQGQPGGCACPRAPGLDDGQGRAADRPPGPSRQRAVEPEGKCAGAAGAQALQSDRPGQRQGPGGEQRRVVGGQLPRREREIRRHHLLLT